VAALEQICCDEQVGLLVPTIDDELEIIGAAKAAFESAGIRVAAAARDVAAICNDKHRTCGVLRGHGIAAAQSWLPGEPGCAPLPLFVKPRSGRGGVGAFMVRTAKELEFFTGYVENPVIQEYLDGAEYTIDMLCDRGRPLSIVPRERVVIRAGVMDRGRTVRDEALVDLALACADALAFDGAVNIQCRMSGGVPRVFEINPRFSGGIPLTIAAGADFPAMLVRLALGERLAPSIGRFTHELWMTSYEASFFVPGHQAAALSPHPPRVPEVA
jgi:carbamoyl-phosphate synthase large subunit